MTNIRTRTTSAASTGLHAKYIGRIGTLAVALGIGAGIAAGPWVASAKPSDSDSPGPDVSVSTNDETQVQKGPAASSAGGRGDNTSERGTGSNNHNNGVNDDTSDATTASGDSGATTSSDNTAKVAENDSDSNAFAGDNNSATVDKSIKGDGTGTIRINTATGALSGEESGVSSHLGKYRLRLQGVGTRSPEGNVSSSGTVTIVAANGDQLTGTFTLTGNEPTLEAVVTITGGTGRFANATGTLTVMCVASGLPGQEEQTLVIKHDCTTDGDISY